MQIGFIGLGKMGGAMAERLLISGHDILGFDLKKEYVDSLVSRGGIGVQTIHELIDKMESPRRLWLMVPSDNVQSVIDTIAPLLSKGDIIIDGGNSFYKDSVRRYEQLKKVGINFLDAGTSGGVWGLKNGYCVMVGGDKNIFEECEPVFKALACEDGYLYTGQSGSGHYVKMVHNGIEYGLMQAYAEGFELMKASDYELKLDKIAMLWENGSVVRSWLLSLLGSALKENPDLKGIRDYVKDSGEGRWTVMDAIEKAVPLPVITESLFARFRSRQEESFGAKILAALRDQFGGHGVEKS